MKSILIIISVLFASVTFAQHPSMFCEHPLSGSAGTTTTPPVASNFTDTLYQTTAPATCGGDTLWVNTTTAQSTDKIFPSYACVGGNWTQFEGYQNTLAIGLPEMKKSNPPIDLWNGGQSNTVSSSAAPTNGDEVNNGSVNNYASSSWELSDAGLGRSAFNSYAFHFAKELSLECDCHVRIMQVGASGQQIERFTKDSTYYAQTVNRSGIVGITEYEVFFYGQGQSNRDQNGLGDSTSYHNFYDAMINGYISEGLITANTKKLIKKLVTGTPDGRDDRNDAILAIAALDPKTAFVDSDGLAMRDPVHLATDGLTFFGKTRAITAYNTIP